jgi:hypothetical protein
MPTPWKLRIFLRESAFAAVAFTTAIYLYFLTIRIRYPPATSSYVSSRRMKWGRFLLSSCTVGREIVPRSLAENWGSAAEGLPKGRDVCT